MTRMKTLQLRDGNVLVISPTQLEKMKSCMAMWRYNYIEGRVAARPSPARDGGKAFDDAMNLRYRRMGSAAPDDACKAAMKQAVADAFIGIELPLEEWRTPARYQEVVELYNEQYGEEPFDVLGVQVPFEVALGEVDVDEKFWQIVWRDCEHDFKALPVNIHDEHRVTGLKCKKCNGFAWQDDWDKGRPLTYQDPVQVRLHGILDLLIRQRDSGLVLVCDTKTASRWEGRDQAVYDNSAQMKAYCWAVPEMRRQLGEAAGPPWATLPERVHGAMINAAVLRKPYVRASAAASAKAQPRTEFHRFVVTYSPERLEEWRRDTLLYVEQALACVARDHYPQNEKHCQHHFGGKCDYVDACVSPASQRHMILDSDLFTDYKRGPLAEVAAAEPEVMP